MSKHNVEQAVRAYYLDENDEQENLDKRIENIHRVSTQEAYLAFQAWREINPSFSRQLYERILKLLGR